MKYFISFTKMESEFSSRASIDRLESIEEMEDRRALVFENSAFIHRAVGLWPKDDQMLGKFRTVKCYIGIFSTIAIFLMQLSLITQKMDKSNIPEFIMETELALHGCIKILPCVLNRKGMINLYHKTLTINSYLKQSSEEKKIAYRWLSLQYKLINPAIIIYLLVVSTYFIQPLYKGDTFPVPGVVPKVFYKLPWMIIVYIFETIACFLRFFVVISCDIYFVIAMCQLCCELKLVQHAILAINKREKQSIYHAIKKHEKALEYGQMICQIFSYTVVFQHLGISMSVCCSAISILYVESHILLIKFTFAALLNSTQLLLLCFVGEKISEESQKIADCIEHAFQMFLDDAASLKTISFMLLRAQKPLMLKIGDNIIINLKLFRETLSKIASFFLVLNRLIKS